LFLERFFGFGRGGIADSKVATLSYTRPYPYQPEVVPVRSSPCRDISSFVCGFDFGKTIKGTIELRGLNALDLSVPSMARTGTSRLNRALFI
jgi:hypothetical protein